MSLHHYMTAYRLHMWLYCPQLANSMLVLYTS